MKKLNIIIIKGKQIKTTRSSTRQSTEWLQWEQAEQAKRSENVDKRSFPTRLGMSFHKITSENYMTKAARDKNAQIPLSTKTSLSYIYSAKLGTFD